MAVIERGRPLVAQRALRVSPARPLRFRYDRGRDVLIAATVPPRPAVSHDLDGEIWVRFVPATGEIVGYEIEDFVASFLPRHPELHQAWSRTRLGFLQRLLRSSPRRELTNRLLAHIRRQIVRQPIQFPLNSAV